VQTSGLLLGSQALYLSAPGFSGGVVGGFVGGVVGGLLPDPPLFPPLPFELW